MRRTLQYRVQSSVSFKALAAKRCFKPKRRSTDVAFRSNCGLFILTASLARPRCLRSAMGQRSRVEGKGWLNMEECSSKRSRNVVSVYLEQISKLRLPEKGIHLSLSVLCTLCVSSPLKPCTHLIPALVIQRRIFSVLDTMGPCDWPVDMSALETVSALS